jgi:CheY-like chemotaxis protein
MHREPITILLIEDNPLDARLLQEFLAEATGGPFELVQVERLANALTCLEEKPYDVVLWPRG